MLSKSLDHKVFITELLITLPEHLEHLFSEYLLLDTCFALNYFLMNWISRSFNICNFISGRSQVFGLVQGRSESTSSVAFEVLIINCHIEFINLLIFNCLTSNINLFIFNYLTSNFSFPKNISFASRKEQLFVDARS